MIPGAPRLRLTALALVAAAGCAPTRVVVMERGVLEAWAVTTPKVRARAALPATEAASGQPVEVVAEALQLDPERTREILSRSPPGEGPERVIVPVDRHHALLYAGIVTLLNGLAFLGPAVALPGEHRGIGAVAEWLGSMVLLGGGVVTGVTLTAVGASRPTVRPVPPVIRPRLPLAPP